jgi:hypothetical protein
MYSFSNYTTGKNENFIKFCSLRNEFLEILRITKIHYPLLIALLNNIILAKSITCLLISAENPQLFILLFDFSFFLNARIHYNICAAIIIILTLCITNTSLHQL